MSEVGIDLAPAIQWLGEEKIIPKVQDNGTLAGTMRLIFFIYKTHKISKHVLLIFSSTNVLFIQYFYKY